MVLFWYNHTMSLIQRVIQGDQAATVEFYHDYCDQIYRYLSHKLPTPDDAHDLMQQTFLDALDSLYTLQDENKILPWLYRIAHHKTVDFYRKRKIKSLLLSHVPFLQLAANEINEPEFQYEKDRIREKIQQTFDCLSDKHKKILIMHYEEGMSIKSIALLLDLSPKATESLLFRARQKFKGVYERT